MATLKARGENHSVIYPYTTADGQKKQQWETYSTELEALQRKTYIDYLQKNKMQKELLLAAVTYRQQRASEKEAKEKLLQPAVRCEPAPAVKEDNRTKTYGEFVEKWLPYHMRKKGLSPNTYDSYRANLNNHILPVFGNVVMSTITSEDIDDFLDSLTMKPCSGSKAYRGDDYVETLSSSSVKKCYTVLTAGFPDAKKWHYIDEIPETTPPAEKTKKRKA